MAPSGRWTGFWHHPVSGQRGDMALDLVVEGTTLRGAGADVVGPFTMTGEVTDSDIFISKQYTGAHLCEYRGNSTNARHYGGQCYQGGRPDGALFELVAPVPMGPHRPSLPPEPSAELTAGSETESEAMPGGGGQVVTMAVALVGARGVGKSRLLESFLRAPAFAPHERPVTVAGSSPVLVSLYDPELRSKPELDARLAHWRSVGCLHGAVFVYNSADPASFAFVAELLAAVVGTWRNICLVANTPEISGAFTMTPTAVPASEGLALAVEAGCPFLEISAAAAEHVDSVFAELAYNAVQQRDGVPAPQTPAPVPSATPTPRREAALVAEGGKIIFMRPCISLGILHTKQTGRHENDFAAHG